MLQFWKQGDTSTKECIHIISKRQLFANKTVPEQQIENEIWKSVQNAAMQIKFDTNKKYFRNLLKLSCE